ncbi:MAG TPA: glucose-6-phosphate isomerase [Clostridiaceae bacterium]|mgnify:CR=1 FL=1|nr:glucose-6-phosphate isomerase [Clostridiaceae bacterium]
MNNSDIFSKEMYETGFVCDFNLQDGLSEKAISTKRYLSQMKGMFSDEEAYEKALKEEDSVIYEFYEMGFPETDAHLGMGTSITYPGKIGDEYYFTKGHFHTILETAEVYYGLSGEGYMLLENPEGDWKFLPIRPGVAVYVPPRYAHRTINTGSVPLITFFTYRADAGHDYGTIETKGYRTILVEERGIPTFKANPKWQEE